MFDVDRNVVFIDRGKMVLFSGVVVGAVGVILIGYCLYCST